MKYYKVTDKFLLHLYCEYASCFTCVYENNGCQETVLKEIYKEFKDELIEEGNK